MEYAVLVLRDEDSSGNYDVYILPADQVSREQTNEINDNIGEKCCYWLEYHDAEFCNDLGELAKKLKRDFGIKKI